MIVILVESLKGMLLELPICVLTGGIVEVIM